MNRILLTTLLAALLPLSALRSPLSAQDGDSVKTFAPVDVSTTRVSTVDPITQTTIDSAALAKVVYGQDVQYILERTAPSIISYSESGTNFSNYGSFRMRGIDQTRINVTLDGAPLNDMIDQGVFFSNMTDLMSGMSSVQVQRGVGSSTNGTASYAGSVDIGTPTDPGRTTAGLLATSGSFRTGRVGLQLSTGQLLSTYVKEDGDTARYGDLFVHARVSALQSDGYRYNTSTTSLSGMVTAVFNARQSWLGPNQLQLTIAGGNTKNELGYYAVPKPLFEQDPRTNINDETDHDDFGQYISILKWKFFMKNSTLLLMGYGGQAGGDYYSGFRDSVGTLTQINYPLQNLHYGGIAQYDVSLGDLEVTGGLHLYRFWRQNWEQVVGDEFAYYADRTVKDEVSGFVKARYDLGKLRLFADVQARAVELRFQEDPNYVPAGTVLPAHDWFFLNPRVGATFFVNSMSNIYVSAGRTGREPTRFDLLGGTQINEANLNVVMQPGTVKPEYALDFELGYRYTGVDLQLSVNAFHMMFTDEISPIGRYIEQQFVQLRKNVPSSSRTGVELEGSYRFLNNFVAAINATVMTASIDTYSPENIGVDTTYNNVAPVLTPTINTWASLSYYPISDLQIMVDARYVSRQFLELTNDPSLILDPYLILNASVAWQANDRTRFTVNAFNITDQVYAANGATGYYNGALVPTLFAQAPFNWNLSLQLSI